MFIPKKIKKSEAFSHTTPIFLPNEYQGKEVLIMKRPYIERIHEQYLQETDKGIEIVTVFERIYL